MKNLKEILEASLLDNAISEASLLDIEGTMNDIDAALAEFEALKKFALDKKN